MQPPLTMPLPNNTRLICQRERSLLMLAALFVSLNHVAIILVLQRSLWILWSMVAWGLCAILLHRTLNRRLPHRDPYLLPAMLLLAGWGLNLIERLAPPFAGRQTIWLLISSTALIGILYLPTHLSWLQNYRYPWLILGVGLVAATILIGVNPSGFGPRLWLSVGPQWYYQPSELLKILLVVFLASYLSDNWLMLRQQFTSLGKFSIPAPGFLTPVLLMFSLCIVLLVWQRDLGTATIFFMVFMLMLYLASGQWLLLVGGGILLFLSSLVGYMLFDVVALRIDVWLNPWNEAEGRAFQIVQSLMAVADGGIIGQGVGQGIPTYIPVVHSDFVFSAIAEEWGFVGVIGLLATIALIVIRGLRIATVSQAQPFRAFLAAGLSLMFAVQSLLIIGGTLRLWPLTGVTLPLVSYGGSSLLTTFMLIGLLLVMSEETPS